MVLTPNIPFIDKIGEISKLILEKDSEPVLKYLEQSFTDKKAAEPIIQIFKIVMLALQ